jgi:hypothetical protein
MSSFAYFIRFATALGFFGWQSCVHATVFRCDINGTTTYQTQACAGGKEVDVRATPGASSSKSLPQSSAQSVPNGAPKTTRTCVEDELSLDFRSIALPMALQVVADFSGRRANVDPSITASVPLNYSCTPWRKVLQDIAQRHQLDIRVEEKWIVVRRR